jgi:hypothetical protein
MCDPSNRVVRFLILISIAGVVFAAFFSKIPWDGVVAILASR